MWFNCVKSLTQISFAFEYKIIKKTWAVFKESNLFRQPWYTPKWKVRRQYSAPAMRKGGSFYNCIWCLTSYHCHQGRLRDAFRMRQKPNSAHTLTHTHTCASPGCCKNDGCTESDRLTSALRELSVRTRDHYGRCAAPEYHTQTHRLMSASHMQTLSV